MTGLSNYTADKLLNHITGQVAFGALPAVYLALFTAVGTDAGTGFTEVSGGAYARVQVAGVAATNAATTTSSATLSFVSTPSWIVAGMSVYDVTTSQSIGTVQSTTATTVVMTANAASAVGSGDTLSFSAWSQGTGTGPSSLVNTAAISFVTATANWGTVIAFGLYDASSSGDLLIWDYIGNFNWLPCTITAASPGVFTAHANGYNNGDSVIFSIEYGGTAPSFSAGNYTGILTVAGATADTFDIAGVNTSSSGNGNVRKIIQQIIPSGVTASFAASTLTVTAA